ncbi:MAG TPA: nitrate- and nitrite sensing domain-containing protein [Polyangia bacterium]|nr:nitrate- and nitrite sensing domain-containing protein [Polyangia bacterium]
MAGMALGVDEATRIVRFCLAGDGWGDATYEGETRVIKLVLNGAVQAASFRFEAATFEAALHLAVEAGVLKAQVVDKQIAFVRQTSPKEPAGGRLRGGGIRPASDDPPEAQTGPVPFSEATGILSALIHETQRERGISSLYAASAGRLFGEQLVGQWRVTERRRLALLALQERFGDRLPPVAAAQLGRAEALLRDIATARVKIEKLQIAPVDVIASYSRMNGELLRVIDGFLIMVVDPAQRPTALAWIALLYAKEKTGVERAQLVSAFERDRYFDGQYQSLLGLIAARESYLHLFAAAAPPTAGDLLHEKLESKTAGAVQKMERIALDHRRGGFGVDPTDWFEAISDQIDFFGDVETAVRSSLTPAWA